METYKQQYWNDNSFHPKQPFCCTFCKKYNVRVVGITRGNTEFKERVIGKELKTYRVNKKYTMYLCKNCYEEFN